MNELLKLIAVSHVADGLNKEGVVEIWHDGEICIQNGDPIYGHIDYPTLYPPLFGHRAYLPDPDMPKFDMPLPGQTAGTSYALVSQDDAMMIYAQMSLLEPVHRLFRHAAVGVTRIENG